MPLDFPASPITGATYTAPNGTIWVWDGAKWANGVYIGTAYAPINAPTFTGDARAVTPAAGDADTSVATTAFVSAAVAPAFNGVGRNLLHNPLFAVAQRGAGPWTTTGVYTLDRWVTGIATDALSVSQITLADADRTQIGDDAATFCCQSVFTGNAAAGAYSSLAQPIEDVRRLSGKTVMVSFYAKAAAGAPTLGVTWYQYFGAGGSPSATVLGTGVGVTLSTTWARYSATFAIPSINGKVLGTAGSNTTLRFTFSSGATNAVFSGVGVQSGTISIWGVQLEVGSLASPLEKPDPQQDLAKCQRFYSTGAFSAYGYQSAGGFLTQLISLPVQMRALPTFTTPTSGSANCSVASDMQSTFQLRILLTATAAGPLNAFGTFTASADL